MCMSIKRRCVCGADEAEFMHRDNILPAGVLINLYCPQCRHQADGDPAAMLEDGGWMLEFDLEEAAYLLWQKGISQEATPDFIFDQGYCSWNGLTPNDVEARSRLHQELAPLLSQDRLQYITRLKQCMLEHVAALKAAGWRKARNA